MRLLRYFFGGPEKPPPPPIDPKPWDGFHQLVEVPDGTTQIPRNAFYAKSCLERVTLPNSLVYVSQGSFMNHIRLPDGLISIGRSAFSYNSSLASITFPASLTLIEHSAFSSCSALKQVVVPTTTEIADRAFHPCTRIVRLPPARMRARQNWHAAVDAALAYKRCRPQLYGWLERAQNRLGSYGPDGAARKRDREEFERDRLLSPLTRASSSEEHAGQGSLIRAASASSSGLVPRPSVRFAAGLDVVIRNELRGAADSLGVKPLRRECRPSRTVHPRLRAYARWVGP